MVTAAAWLSSHWTHLEVGFKDKLWASLHLIRYTPLLIQQDIACDERPKSIFSIACSRSKASAGLTVEQALGCPQPRPERFRRQRLHSSAS